MPKHNKQSGSALLTALVITAIASAIITLIFLQQSIAIRETNLIFNHDRALRYLVGTKAWAAINLINAAKKAAAHQQPTIDKMPQIMSPQPFHQATIAARLIDQQSKLNINALVNLETYKIYFVRLLQLVEPKLTTDQALQLCANISAWLTPSSADMVYSKMQPPYLAAHQPMTNISELRLVTGISADLYQKLAPYLATLPTNKLTVNPNTASATVLAALLNIKVSIAKLIVTKAQQQPFISLDDFTQFLANQQITVPNSSIFNLTSNYFQLQATAKIDQQTIHQTITLQRVISNNQIAIRTIAQS